MKHADFEHVLNQLERAHSASQAAMLLSLREQGATISQAIKAVRHLYAVSLGEAKARVAGDSSWSVVDKAAVGLRQDAQDALAGRPSAVRREHA